MFKMQPSERASSKDKFERLGKSIGDLCVCVYTFHRGKELDGQCRAINLHLLKDLHILILRFGLQQSYQKCRFYSTRADLNRIRGGGGFYYGLRVGPTGVFFKVTLKFR